MATKFVCILMTHVLQSSLGFAHVASIFDSRREVSCVRALWFSHDKVAIGVEVVVKL